MAGTGNAGIEGPGGPDLPRQRRRREAEQRILEAARAILLEGTSVDALSLREVARRADFTPGALYRYFDDRMDLIATLFREAGRHLGASFPEPPESPDVAWMEDVGVAYLKFAGEHPEDLMLLFQHRARVASWKEYVVMAWPFSLIVTALEDGAKRGVIVLPSGLDAAGTALAFWSLLHGMTELRRAHLRDIRGDFETMQRAALSAFLSILQPPSTTPAPHGGSQ